MGLLGILSDTIRILKNVTDLKNRKSKIKDSDEWKEAKSQEKENKIYDDLAKGDNTLVDIARKEKQKKIDNLKRITSIIILLFCISGCDTLDPQVGVTGNILKETDKSYPIEREQIYSTQKGDIRFGKDWNIVHKDYIKEHLENQDELILALEKLEEEQKKNSILISITVGLSSSFLLAIVLLITFIKKKRD